MIEKFLLDIGMRCGTVKNFSVAIADDLRKGDGQHWYFLTPIKVTDGGNGLKTCTVNLAYPFISERGDVTEQDVFNRLYSLSTPYQIELINQLRKNVIVPSFTFSIVPFWANDKGERTERKDFGGARIHILNAVVNVNYRLDWFKNN
jgi:hypothetical protein